MSTAERTTATVLSVFICVALPTAICGPPTTCAATVGYACAASLMALSSSATSWPLCSVSALPKGEESMTMARVMSGVKMYPSSISKVFCMLLPCRRVRTGVKRLRGSRDRLSCSSPPEGKRSISWSAAIWWSM